MKIRTGFVSNSSSSSFIIGFPAGMAITEENVHRELYGTDKEQMFDPKYIDGQISSKAVVKDVVAQIAIGIAAGDYSSSEKRMDTVTEAVNVDIGVDIDHFRIPEKDKAPTNWEIDWVAYDNIHKVEYQKEVNRVSKELGDVDLYVVSFSDGDGSFNTEVEHGDALNSCKIVTRYSHH